MVSVMGNIRFVGTVVNGRFRVEFGVKRNLLCNNERINRKAKEYWQMLVGKEVVDWWRMMIVLCLYQ